VVYHVSNCFKPGSTTEHWRALAEYWHISPKARERLEWLIFYYSFYYSFGRLKEKNLLGKFLLELCGALTALFFDGMAKEDYLYCFGG